MKAIRSRWKTTLAITLAIMAAVAVGAASGMLFFQGDSGSETHVAASRIEFTSLSQLTASSDAVVVGTLQSESREQVRASSPVDPAHADTRTDVIRVFSVSEVIKGGSVPSGTISVRATEAGQVELPNGSKVDLVYDVVSVRSGLTYVLFLRRLTDPGIGQFWAIAGEPGAAEVRAGRLLFVTTPGFARDLRARGALPGASGAGPAFDVTLDQVRSAVAKLAQPSP